MVCSALLGLALLAVPTGEWTIAPSRLPDEIAALRLAAEDVALHGAPADTLGRRLHGAVIVCGPHRYDLTWLTEAVATGDPVRLVAAWDRLKAWQTALAPTVELDRKAVPGLVASILSEDAYRPVRASSWIEPWLPVIERFFDTLFAPLLRRSREDNPWRDTVAVLTGGLAVALAAGLLLRRLRRQVQPVGHSLPPAATSPGLDAAAWRQEAERRWAAGDGLSALVWLYRALLARLDETGRLRYDPSRTNWENACQVADAVVADGLRELARVLDAVLYGGRPCEPATVQRCGELVDRLWSME